MHRSHLRPLGFGKVGGLLSVIIASVLISACAAAMQAGTPAPLVRPGIDVLLTDSIGLVRGKRVGFVTNVAAVDRAGVSAISRLRGAGINLVALFGPEHGLTVTAAPGEEVRTGVDTVANIPIYSLYGETRAPTPAMLVGIDVLLIDLPDAGSRYFTYLATTIEVLKAAAPHNIPVVILDRPDPIGGGIEGNILDTAYRSSIGLLAVPMRHGLTLAEGARLAKLDMGLPGQLLVVPAAAWRRSMSLDQTGLPFLPPSPNLKDLEALFHYPGTCLFEGTALSVGRGTDQPFHQIGAAWLDTTAVLRLVRAARLPGVRFEGVAYTPRKPGDGKSADTLVRGIRLIMTDAVVYRPVAAALHLLAAVQAVHPSQIRYTTQFERLAGGPLLRRALEAGQSASVILAGWEADLASFQRRSRGLLLYQ